MRVTRSRAERVGLGAVTAGAAWALGLLELGLGDPASAVERLDPVVDGRVAGRSGVALWAAADLVDAAARAGVPQRGRDALTRLGTWARRVGAPWAIAVAHRGAAQLAGGDPAGFAAALDHHADGVRPLERARTRLAHGEALRRRRRRMDARVELRAAAEAFERAGATPWAQRARTELRATGETVGRPDSDGHVGLTPQELRIATLAASGSSNPEIAALLFLSRRTVEYHLHKVFTKLGIAGRADLARIGPVGAGRHTAPDTAPDG
jgi:DNA-binding NarL/FixJ family response regulator